MLLWLLSITFGGVLGKHYEVDSLLFRLLWFTRARETEPGKCSWEDDNTDMVVMCFTHVLRTL